jgi:uncharacterized membrane protein YfcA
VVAAIIMLMGASVGAQIGSVATKYVRGYGIRLFFGFAVVGCAISIVLKLIASAWPAGRVVLDTMATVLILGLVAVLSLYIFSKFLSGVREELGARKKEVTAAV